MRNGFAEAWAGVGRWAVLALLAAAGCAGPKAQFSDADWISHSTTGRNSHGRGDYRRAAEAYGRAQQRARALDDAEALAVASANRAVCLLADGEAAAARRVVAEALADGRVSEGRRAELLAIDARAAMDMGLAEAALERAGGALALRPSAAVRAQAALAQSAARLVLGDADRAELDLAGGLSAKEWGRLPASLRAERGARRGQIAAARGRAAEAAAEFEAAADTWRSAGRLPEMARALAKAGRELGRAGDAAGAADRLFRAARSLWAQGLRDEAAGALAESVERAAEAGDEAMGLRLAEWIVTFGNPERPRE